MNQLWHFAPFCLDTASERLWCDGHAVTLRPKSFQLLRYLVEHPNRLVTYAEVMQALWHHAHRSEGLLRSYVKEVRRALGDDAAVPRFIETAKGRGYRFLAVVTSATAGVASLAITGLPSGDPDEVLFVGREDSLAWLGQRFGFALSGQRQVVWISGEPGIGKTALAEQFVRRTALSQPLHLARGQCVEQHGRGEPYMPVLEALGRLAHDHEHQVIPTLRRHAPSWLIQLPGVIDATERLELMASTFGVTQERMARELTEALEALSCEKPVILWLEDLHWTDPSTVQLLDQLARRFEPARLLILGTYRPQEAAAPMHFFRAAVQELRAHNLCADLPLQAFTQEEATRYSVLKFKLEPGSSVANVWGRLLYARTDGVPLFLTALADELGNRLPVNAESAPKLKVLDTLGAVGVPANLFNLFERQIEGLSSEEQHLLGAAAVSGMEFSTALVAAVQKTEIVVVQALCERLVSGNLFICETPNWPGPEKRAADRFRFRHALQREAFHRRLPRVRLRRLHRQLGKCKEASYEQRKRVVAAELATHFELGGDYERAVRNLIVAAQQALLRAANREAIDHLRHALELLMGLPHSPDRDRQELELQTMVAMPLLMTEGYTAPAVKRAFSRAFELTEGAELAPELFSSLFGLFRHALVGGDLARANKLADQMLRVSEFEPGHPRVCTANLAVAAVQYHLGALEPALDRLQSCLHSGDAGVQRMMQHGEDDISMALAHAAWILTVLGDINQAEAHAARLRARAEALDHPFAHMESHLLLAFHGFISRESQRALFEADAGLALGQKHEFSPLMMASLVLHRGWALAHSGQAQRSLPEMRTALDGIEAAGVRLWYAFSCLEYGEACLYAGKPDEALRVVEAASAAALEMGQGGWLPECQRLLGEVQFKCSNGGKLQVREAEGSLLYAIELAQRQRAKLTELRAVKSLARLRLHAGTARETLKSLAEVYSRFDEGHDHHDLVDTRSLLKRLNS
jgi:DNA-binding winged helix-turn-helix (wHTH) protein/tetratricopeptide (TPR) repeat protein